MELNQPLIMQGDMPKKNQPIKVIHSTSSGSNVPLGQINAESWYRRHYLQEPRVTEVLFSSLTVTLKSTWHMWQDVLYKMANGNNWVLCTNGLSGGSVTLVFFVFPFISFNSRLSLKQFYEIKVLFLNSNHNYLIKC